MIKPVKLVLERTTSGSAGSNAAGNADRNALGTGAGNADTAAGNETGSIAWNAYPYTAYENAMASEAGKKGSTGASEDAGNAARNKHAQIAHFDLCL